MSAVLVRVPRLRLKGLPWVVWRQHRAAFWTGAALALAAVAYIAWRRAELMADLHENELSQCVVEGWCPGRRLPLVGYAGQGSRWGNRMHDASVVLTWVPVLVGTFLGGPLLARELESGTHRLMLTQSAVGRGRWLAAKLGVSAAVTVVCTGAVAAAYTWWWLCARMENAGSGGIPLWGPLGDQDEWAYLGSVGPVVVAGALLGLALGATAGLLVRRTVPAMAAALAVTTGARFGLEWLRRHLIPPVSVTCPIDDGCRSLPNRTYLPPDAWYMSEGFVTATGRKVSYHAPCGQGVDWETCSTNGGLVRQYAVYHPESHFWPLQWAETGLCAVVAVALVVFCLWWIRRLPA